MVDFVVVPNSGHATPARELAEFVYYITVIISVIRSNLLRSSNPKVKDVRQLKAYFCFSLRDFNLYNLQRSAP